MRILSSYSTFPPATLQNNLFFNYILMAYHVTAKLLQYKFNSGNFLNLCVLRWFHGIIMSSFISPKILSKQAFSFGTHFKITYYTIRCFYHKVNNSHKICHLTAALLRMD